MYSEAQLCLKLGRGKGEDALLVNELHLECTPTLPKRGGEDTKVFSMHGSWLWGLSVPSSAGPDPAALLLEPV
jgi:hypothetical protein